MLSKLIIRNFKRFDDVAVELGSPVVFVGPNNSGKTSALQALALWEAGVRKWTERRERSSARRRPGVTINRRDLVSVPIPRANLLWKDLRVRNVQQVSSKPHTDNIYIDIIVEGVSGSNTWTCGLEFYYANEESFYCRPLRLTDVSNPDRMPIPEEAKKVSVAFLPPMSGLAANEVRLDSGAINVRVGEGRTADVLRNLCYSVYTELPQQWAAITEKITELFGTELDAPDYIIERGEIAMTYREHGVLLDLSSAGRGLQQTLLLLAYMYAHPGTILVLDEPDAHLEILRQRQVYRLLVEAAAANGNQIIAASHSEVLLNEASNSDVVVAFVGKPHRIGDRGSQVMKALRDIGFEDYYLAEQTGWVLYVEGSTDLTILQEFAEKTSDVVAMNALARPFVKYVGNQPSDVRRHFHGLRDAVPSLKGFALFDRLEQELPADLGAIGYVWKKREIESYLCLRTVLERYAQTSAQEELPGPLFASVEPPRRVQAMRDSIDEVEEALAKLTRGSPWDGELKVSEEFLEPVFRRYYERLELPNEMAKKNFHVLARFIEEAELAPEVSEVLKLVSKVSSTAEPAGA